MKLTLSEIAALCGGTLCGDGSVEVTGFYTDSRQTQPGMMFVPIRGENTDAHRFIPQVFEMGAAATFSETELENPTGPVVYVKDSRAALQAVAEGGIAESRFTSYLSMLEDKDEDKYRGAT